MKEDDYLPISDTSREDFKKFYTWTIEDATSAQEEWGKGDHNSYAKGPLFKYLAVHELKEIADKEINKRNNYQDYDKLKIRDCQESTKKNLAEIEENKIKLEKMWIAARYGNPKISENK